MKKLFLGGCLFVSLLTVAACQAEPTADEVFETASDVHSETDSMDVSFEIEVDDVASSWMMRLDYKNDTYYLVTDDEYAELYQEDDTIGIIINGSVMNPEATRADSYKAVMANFIEHHENPMRRLKEFDETIEEKFELEVTDSDYILTYSGDEKAQQLYAEGLAEEIREQDPSAPDFTDVSANKIELTITIDKETERIQEIHEVLDYTVTAMDEANDIVVENTYTYSNFQSVEIEKPELLDTLVGEEEQALYEDEAANYLEALIEATVYQNAEDFGENAAGSGSPEEKQSEGDHQKESFKEFYRQNTEENMGEVVSSDAIDALTDAFMEALSQTSYEVVDSQLVSNEQIVVTLSIEGLQDWAIQSIVEKKLIEEVEAGDVEQEDIFERNVELLIDVYENAKQYWADPIEVDVTVSRLEDGTYMVFVQDEYLIGGFVQ
ncbi:hypothetical protein MM221_10995 [Salipaludibacillus sp. LMS25]|uniref:DUF6612 family protein n=1 Tax=Salipaludibacillus sp. LMS25 TaxID=2924031 RepID=UPI0020D078AF|nr:DUF6612 family protein [Salipaludibacillus sp. LMS25]UTR13182.1 hypothetical protein MM221_10995 [Salipaludibacillus sp. LMS25]